jgi:hypothetical protein
LLAKGNRDHAPTAKLATGRARLTGKVGRLANILVARNLRG